METPLAIECHYVYYQFLWDWSNRAGPVSSLTRHDRTSPSSACFNPFKNLGSLTSVFTARKEGKKINSNTLIIPQQPRAGTKQYSMHSNWAIVCHNYYYY